MILLKLPKLMFEKYFPKFFEKKSKKFLSN